MLNTVLGEINTDQLGNTRIHEHVLWGWTADMKEKFSKQEVMDIMLPQLIELKEFGCNTIVECTPEGAGRDVEVLAELSEKSGVNIISNCGVWDGLNYGGIYVPDWMKTNSSQEIADKWIAEFENGIDGTNIRPGFIKIGLGDFDTISEFQYTFLEAAIITSKQTGMPIIAHICSSRSAKEIVEIVSKSGLYLNRFVWSHADYKYDDETIIKLAKKGAWVDLSWNTATSEVYAWYIKLINTFERQELLDHLLISQDAGGFHAGEITPYRNFYSALLKECKDAGISDEIIDKFLVENPAKLLDNRY